MRRANSADMAVIFAVCSIALVGITGSAIDLSRRVLAKSELQQRLDTALREAALAPAGRRVATAEAVFDADTPQSIAQIASRSFQIEAGGLSGTATAAVPTTLSSVLGVRSLAVQASGRVAADAVGQDATEPVDGS